VRWRVGAAVATRRPSVCAHQQSDGSPRPGHGVEGPSVGIPPSCPRTASGGSVNVSPSPRPQLSAFNKLAIGCRCHRLLGAKSSLALQQGEVPRSDSAPTRSLRHADAIPCCSDRSPTIGALALSFTQQSRAVGRQRLFNERHVGDSP